MSQPSQQTFSLSLTAEQAQATLSALEGEVESCVRADLRDRQSFGFGPIIHEDSARDRAYLDARRAACFQALTALLDAGVPYAAESLQRAQGAQSRIWAAFRGEQEETALVAKLDQDKLLHEALRVASVAMTDIGMSKQAKCFSHFDSLDTDIFAALHKANNGTEGWAKEVRGMADRMQGLAHSAPESRAAKIYQAGFALERAATEARRRAKPIEQTVSA